MCSSSSCISCIISVYLRMNCLNMLAISCIGNKNCFPTATPYMFRCLFRTSQQAVAWSIQARNGADQEALPGRTTIWVIMRTRTPAAGSTIIARSLFLHARASTVFATRRPSLVPTATAMQNFVGACKTWIPRSPTRSVHYSSMSFK